MTRKLAAEPAGVKMPFGCYRGLRLEQIPYDYLFWLLGVAKDWLRPHVQAAIQWQKANPDQAPKTRHRPSPWASSAKGGYRQRVDYDHDDDFDGGINSFGDNGGFFG